MSAVTGTLCYGVNGYDRASPLEVPQNGRHNPLLLLTGSGSAESKKPEKSIDLLLASPSTSNH